MGMIDVLAAAMKAHPELRVGQLLWTAASIVCERDSIGRANNDDANVFYISDEMLAKGLAMVAEKGLLSDESSQLAERIKSYLTRKTGSSLDGEMVDHIAKLIRDSQ